MTPLYNIAAKFHIISGSSAKTDGDRHGIV